MVRPEAAAVLGTPIVVARVQTRQGQADTVEGPLGTAHGPDSGPKAEAVRAGRSPADPVGSSCLTAGRQIASPGRPYRPAPPPPPLSKDALAGNVPLRTFGQLKQLWEARVEPKDASRRPVLRRNASPSGLRPRPEIQGNSSNLDPVAAQEGSAAASTPTCADGCSSGNRFTRSFRLAQNRQPNGVRSLCENEHFGL